jgi:hypothetical protein
MDALAYLRSVRLVPLLPLQAIMLRFFPERC